MSKKALRALALSLFLCLTALAGDTPNPGIEEPPPCTENCPESSTQSVPPFIIVWVNGAPFIIWL